MIELENMFFRNRRMFRIWLKQNFDKSPGIWIIIYKKHVITKGIKHREALEEALCFGWIDSLLKRIDDERYKIKFTPRKNIKQWSDVNKKIVGELIINGKMTEAGLKKIESYLRTGKVYWAEKGSIEPNKKEFEIPQYILNEFAKNQPALTNFNNLAKTYQRYYILWITIAKTEKTILKRLNEAIELLRENKKLELK
ncbi:MAG: hypothetical protein HN704_06675 [Bacteroidetes bacterium]|jgi:uncharacterized protein YdeI (YjbR/CyaY-like superfamily)|nr:hypothetical protein [Bacteroidota bacterium]MBT6686454.1 hypothetical protein [Bacteroidota bacterium]MBT7144693.1 hypothetical protein [Bacteroidota bacterium]MBT7491271.1 hypothetical protein [Bacteroidota bacterium]